MQCLIQVTVKDIEKTDLYIYFRNINGHFRNMNILYLLNLDSITCEGEKEVSHTVI